MSDEDTSQELKRKKASYVGVPAIFKLELACQHLNRAFCKGFGCYLVGSAGERPDWRDVDVVLILDDDAFDREFPGVNESNFEFDPKWLINSISISGWLREQTGLPIDFKIQRQSWANARHNGRRRPLGLRFAQPDDQE